MELPYMFDKPAVIKDWTKSVRPGTFIPIGHVILTYEEISADGGAQKVQRLKSTRAGTVQKLLAPKGEVIKKGTPLLLIEPCKHPTVMRDMCAECGMDLRKLDEPNQQTASVSMVHSVPELRVSMEQAQKLGKVDEDRLLEARKLVLLVDLDQTLIHTTNDNVPNNIKDVFHFQLWGHGSVWYHTRIRPHTLQFLENISKLYELHICTFGTRQYAYTIAHELDRSKALFSDRILSRDECFSQNSKTANLKELFPRGDHMVCIIDDREDVWNFAPNLIHVKPYHFFRHTGDINAPPGLAKKDQDDKTGFQFDEDKVEKSKTKSAAIPKTEDNASSSDDSSTNSTDPKPNLDRKPSITEVSADLNLSEDDDSDDKDSGKEEAAIDADMEESNEEDNSKESKSIPSSSKVQNEELSESSKPEISDAVQLGKVSESCEGSIEISNPVTTSTTITLDSSQEAVVSKESPAEPELAGKADNKPEESPASSAEKLTDKKDKSPAAVLELNTDDVKKDIDVGSNVSNEVGVEPGSKSSAQEIPSENPNVPKLIEVEDEDDYLLYLEQILTSIHDAFYSLHEDMLKRKEAGVPDVKTVIPYVRRKVLKGCSIVFSGVVPTHVPLHNSKAYQIAIGLGARVSDKIIPPNKPGTSSNVEPPTTHVVAARMGTAKVNEARRYKGIHIVTPEWLWTCAERWEHVEEKLFRLEKAKNVKRNPPPHCSSPDFRREKFECITPIDDETPSTSQGAKPAMRKERTPSGRFMDTINPLLSFSAREIETMAHEVDDIFNESESSSSDDEEELLREKERAARRRSSRSSSGQDNKLEDPSTSELTKESLSSSSSTSNSSDDDSNPFKEDSHSKKRKRQTETETEDEPISAKFRRGEPLPSDIDSLNLMNPSSDDDDADGEANEEDEWMAQALEREFLDENSRSQDSFDMR